MKTLLILASLMISFGSFAATDPSECGMRGPKDIPVKDQPAINNDAVQVLNDGKGKIGG